MQSTMTQDETKRKVRFVVFWQRLANSGVFECLASDGKDAIRQLGYSPEYVEMRAYQISGEPVVIGKIG